MWHSIGGIVAQFKQTWAREIDDGAIEDACREAGHQWRERRLPPVTTIKLFLLQILFGNTACVHLPRLSGLGFTASAYCEARARLPLAALQTLLTRSTARMAECVRDTGRWLGHRVFLVDGSNFSMSDTPELQREFGQSSNQKPGCGFPLAHWLVLVHAASGLVQKMFTAPLRTHDLSSVVQLHPELQPGDVLVGDRGFCSFAHLALLAARGVQAMFRIHQTFIVDFTPARPHVEPRLATLKRGKGQPRSRWLKQLGPLDQCVEWFKPVQCPPWMTAEQFAALPATLVVRELRYRVTRHGFRVRDVTLVTTLLDPNLYPADALANLYRLRWTIETHFKQLKTTMHMDVLHCQTVAGVHKELTMFVLVYNLVRMVVLQAARQQEVHPDRISFIDAVRWLATAGPGAQLPKLVVNPLRPGRLEPRVRKRRPKEYPLMTKPRDELRKALAAQQLNA
jgi:DDE family transposase